MKYLLIFLIWPLALLSAQAPCRVTFRLSVPEYTPATASVYLAGNLNDWNPKHPDYKLRRQGKIFRITISRPRGYTMEFKFTRGDWRSVEKDATGQEISNHRFIFSQDNIEVKLKVGHWADHFSVKQQHTISGKVEIIDNFAMPQLQSRRRIWIYLPQDYLQSDRRYPVLYMHDGQNLFDAATSFSGEWQVDETLERLFREGKHQGVIVVGIDNGGVERRNEYMPWSHPKHGGGKGEAYCQFIVTTLKPYIDNRFRTFPEPEFTGIAGSSLGGLISMYAIVKYPHVFGKAGVFSPAFWFNKKPLLQMIATTSLKKAKIYIDVGTEEGDHKDAYVQDAREVHSKLIASGVPQQQLRLVIDRGAIHHEKAWARRFPTAFLWLFAK